MKALMSGNEKMEQVLKKLEGQLGESATLIAVSKYRPKEDIEKAYALGQRDFGESRVMELRDKAKELEHLKDIRWHFIGNLQSKKVRTLLKIPKLYSIHSVDSQKLLNNIMKEQEYFDGESCQLFLQVNSSGEEQKSGFKDLDSLREIYQHCQESSKLGKLKIAGLMTMGKIRTDDFEKDARDCFSKLKMMANQLSPELLLSMGMSDDYKIALEEGSNYVRIGTAIFGDREY